MVSHIAKPLNQHQADVKLSTVHTSKKIQFATFDPFSRARSHILPGAYEHNGITDAYPGT